MPTWIAILEDDTRRVAEMRRVLEASGMHCEYFNHAGAMIRWLHENPGKAVLLSLDHDLPLHRVDGEMVDFGTGRQVVDFLVGLPVKIPVIIHSSNEPASVGMTMALAGWQHARVYPNGDLDWIGDAWIEAVMRLLPDQGSSPQ